jgi:CDP-diacylglycerol--glycerol-3-phosphate 3-phosphatidyltransferase
VIDAVAGSVVGAAGLAVAAAWLGSARLRSTPVARIERGGSSALLGRGVQRVAYRALEAIAPSLTRAGITANAVTLASVPFAAAAALAFAYEHYGVGALLGGVAYACDAVDGMIARATGTASDAGEVLDAVCDRVCEAMMLGGLAIAWRGSTALLAVALLAELAACQVTLASAKADGFPAARPRVARGLMRRAERAAYLVGAAALSGVLRDALPAQAGATLAPAARIPLVAAMALVAVLGNASALSRLLGLARALRGDEGHPDVVVHARAEAPGEVPNGGE